MHSRKSVGHAADMPRRRSVTHTGCGTSSPASTPTRSCVHTRSILTDHVVFTRTAS
jgi:hypothetical protein